MRLSQKDLKSSITEPKKERVQDDTTSTINYNSKGQTDVSRKKKFNKTEACASATRTGRNQTFRIKSKRGGQFFNPLKVTHGYGLDVIDKTTNDNMFQLREVNQKAFDAYIKFLQTGHDSYLFVAEREV